MSRGKGLIVERVGTHTAPISQFPNPASDSRPGTSTPRRWHSVSAPYADRSDTQITPSVSGIVSSNRAIACAPSRIEIGGAPAAIRRPASSPCACIAAMKPARRSVPRVSRAASPPMKAIRVSPRATR